MVATLRVRRTNTGTVDRIIRNMFGLKKEPRVAVGFPAGKIDNDVINRAFWNEFGTRGSGKSFGTPRGGGFGGPIPERPFMRNAMRNNKGKYRQAMKAAAPGLLMGTTSLTQVLSKLGILAQGDIQAEIVSLRSPPNSPVTIAIKGSSNPLIDSGEMHQAVTWKIEND